jgi:hypothetical protein
MHHLVDGVCRTRNVGFNPEGLRKLRDAADWWMERREDLQERIMAVIRASAASIAQDTQEILSIKYLEK